MVAQSNAKSGRRASKVRNVAILSIGIAAIGYGIFNSVHAAANPHLILASGSIEADETVIAPKVAGQLARLLVDEGDDVKKGQLLAVLDDSELRAQLGQAEANQAAAKAKLDEAINGNRPEQIEEAKAQLAAAENSYAGAQRNFGTATRNVRLVTDLKLAVDAGVAKLSACEAAYRQATEALRLELAGSRPQQIAEAQAALEQAKVTLSNAQIQYTRDHTLFQQGAISGQADDNSRTGRDAAQKAVDQAQAHLADLVAGPRPQEIREAQMQVLQAKADLEGARSSLADARQTYSDRLNARTQYDSASSNARVAKAQVEGARAQFDLMLAGSRSEDVRNAKATLDQTAKAVTYARELVQDTRLYAPSDAVVKTKSALRGETLSPGTPVVTLADLDHIWIRVYVPEDQYGKLRLGQSVDVTVDSFPGKTFQGKILAISSDAEFTPKNAQTNEERVKLVFGVKIGVSNPGRRLKPGMPGDAKIHIP